MYYVPDNISVDEQSYKNYYFKDGTDAGFTIAEGNHLTVMNDVKEFGGGFKEIIVENANVISYGFNVMVSMVELHKE